MIGLPSLAALDRAALVRIWLAVEPADMRCGFDRLAERARPVTEQDAMSGHLFVFRSRRADRLKILLWDRDGYACAGRNRRKGEDERTSPGKRVAPRPDLEFCGALREGRAEA